MTSAVWRDSKEATRSEGIAPSDRLIRFPACRSIMADPVTTEMAIGVFWRLVSLLVAVTTTSSRVAPVSSATSAAKAGVARRPARQVQAAVVIRCFIVFPGSGPFRRPGGGRLQRLQGPPGAQFASDGRLMGTVSDSCPTF